MMKEACLFVSVVFLFIFLIILCGCSTTIPSKAISNSVKNELNAISSDIDGMSGRLPPECETNALKTIKIRLDNISGQVENISLSCQTEKKVLEEKINVRNVIIVFLGFLVLLVGYLLFKK